MSFEDDPKLKELQRKAEGLIIPRHVAIIMDGNGRWAQQRGMPRIYGHLQGRHATKRAVRAARALGVQVLSLYAFSVENWRRPEDEVQGLFDLMARAVDEELDELRDAGVRFVLSGRMEGLPDWLQERFERCIAETANNSGMMLNLCVNYGGRAEIVDACRTLCQQAASGSLAPEQIDEELFSRHLYVPEAGDVDLLIRTGAEHRVSNFLLWQISYAEFVVLDIFWPDFTEDHLLEAIEEFNRRERRFGGLGPSDDGR